ncbi:hypothetical protein V494_07306 [Pseudogymnoascus sp. VKM F-4513 (FW-928)]|nr:hypothetical protein V494_07306 [Pseudogymnoascus sp. VKM F-4513 (FW-928)]
MSHEYSAANNQQPFQRDEPPQNTRTINTLGTELQILTNLSHRFLLLHSAKMMFLAAMTWIVPVVLGAPQLSSLPRDLKDATLLIKFDKTSLEQEVAVVDMESQVLGQSCSKTLDSGAFANFPISADLDPNGAGNVTLNGQSYLVHEHADFSGGITCTRIYGDEDSFVRCSIKVPNSLQTKPLTAENTKACFTRGTLDTETTSNAIVARHAGSKEYDLDETSLSMSEHRPNSFVRGTSSANGPPDCSWRSDVVLIGNGDPHQNYRHTQLTIPIDCGHAKGCGCGESDAISYSINYTVGGAFFGWVNGGFSVTKTISTGRVYSCAGGPGQTICMMKKTAHTAYSVRERQRSRCDPTQYGDKYILVSPNANDRGSGFYCIVGSCKNQGDFWMDRNGRAGGP